MREKELKDKLLFSLKSNYRDWQVENYPPVIDDFVDSQLNNQNGAILIKSLGFSPIYFMNDNSINPLIIQDFIQVRYRFLILIIAKKMLSADEILLMTKDIIIGLRNIELLENTSPVVYESVGEALVDEITGYISREIIISQLAFENLGE